MPKDFPYSLWVKEYALLSKVKILTSRQKSKVPQTIRKKLYREIVIKAFKKYNKALEKEYKKRCE